MKTHEETIQLAGEEKTGFCMEELVESELKKVVGGEFLVVDGKNVNFEEVLKVGMEWEESAVSVSGKGSVSVGFGLAIPAIPV